jgi:tetratricopeptide (TPR) repeat protein
LTRALARTSPDEAQEMQARFLKLQGLQRATDDASMLGNSALSASAKGDWPQAIAQLKAAIERCGECSARAQLHKNLGLVLCRSGDLKNGESELRAAKAMLPEDKDIDRALLILQAH